jgi:hypothetical protein
MKKEEKPESHEVYTKCDATERNEYVDMMNAVGSVPVLRKIGDNRWALSWERKDLVAGLKKCIRGNREYFIAED